MEGILWKNKGERRCNQAVLTMLQERLHVDGSLMQTTASQCWPMTDLKQVTKAFEKVKRKKKHHVMNTRTSLHCLCVDMSDNTYILCSQ